jgi:hypothetical protein
MGSFDREIIDLVISLKEKNGGNAKGNHPIVTSTRTLIFLKWGKVTCLSNQTFKCGGSPSQGPSPDHRGVTPAATCIMSLNVGLGSTLDLTTITTKCVLVHQVISMNFE